MENIQHLFSQQCKVFVLPNDTQFRFLRRSIFTFFKSTPSPLYYMCFGIPNRQLIRSHVKVKKQIRSHVKVTKLVFCLDVSYVNILLHKFHASPKSIQKYFKFPLVLKYVLISQDRTNNQNISTSAISFWAPRHIVCCVSITDHCCQIQ